MPNSGVTQYNKGARSENYVIERLEKDGWYCVRSAASRGLFDIVITKYGYTAYVQVKRNHVSGLAEQYIEIAKQMSVDTVLFWRSPNRWFGQYTRWFGETYGSWFDDIQSRLNHVAEQFAYVERGHDVKTLEAFE